MATSDDTGPARDDYTEQQLLLLGQAAEMLGERGIAAIEEAIAFDVLSQRAGYARQTVHYHLKTRSEAVLTLADFLFRPSTSNVDEALEQVMQLFRDTDPNQRAERFQAALALNYILQMSNPAMGTTWLLHAAALCSKPPKDPPKSDERREKKLAAAEQRSRVAAGILSARARFYDDMAGMFRPLFSASTRVLGRAPMPETDIDEIILLLHALSDGLALRATIHPDRVTPELVGRAMYRLAESFTVDRGVTATPGRPIDEQQAATYDRIITAAAEAWRTASPDAPPSLESVAAGAGLATEMVQHVFGTLEQLSEAVARTLVPADELIAAIGARYPLDIISTALDALAAEADDRPLLFASLPSDGDLIHDLVDTVDEALRRGIDNDAVVTADPRAAAASLVDEALRGTPGTPHRHLLERLSGRGQT